MSHKLYCLCLFLLCLAYSPCLIHAQTLKHMYSSPKSREIRVIKDIPFSKDFKFDLYQPLQDSDSSVVIIMNGFGIPAQKNAEYQVEWARVLAADGIHAVTFESHAEDVEGDFDRLVEHLQKNAKQYSLHPEKFMVMAFSGNVVKGLPIVTDPVRKTISAAIIYYGYGPVISYKPDLSILFVRSGLDNPSLNRKIDTIAFQALSQNAPWQFINHHSGKHPFEFDAPDGQSMAVIRQTLDFMHAAVSAPVRRSIQLKMDEVKAGTALYTGEWNEAIVGYRKLTDVNPSADNYLKLGHAYRGGEKHAEAMQAYEKAFQAGEKRMGDLAIPASLSAAALQDKEQVFKWLKRLPATPWATSFIQTTVAFHFVKDDPAWADLSK